MLKYPDLIKMFINIFTFTSILLQFTKPFKYFSSLRLKSENLFLVGDDGIYIYSPDMNNVNSLQTLSLYYDVESDDNTFDKVVIKQYENNEEILCRVNKNFYLFSEKATICDKTIDDKEMYYTDIIPFKKEITNDSIEYYYLVAYTLGNQPMMIEKYKYIIKDSHCDSDNSNFYLGTYQPKIPAIGYSTDCLSNLISCQIMYSEELKKNILICFCQNSTPMNLVSYSFEIDGNLDLISSSVCEEENLDKYYDLKTSLYKDKTKAIVCVVNEKGKEICYIYDLTENKWNNKFTVFDDCSVNKKKVNNIFINYINETNEYILYCNVDNGYNFIILDEFFQIATKYYTNQNCVSLYKYNNYSNYITYFPSLNNYYGINYCSKLEKQKLFSDISNICIKNVNRSENTSINNTNKTETEKEETEKNKTETEKEETEKNKTEKEINYIIENNINKAITTETKENIVNNIENIISNVEIGKQYEIEGDDYYIKIYPINTKFNENSTYVNLSECESLLRKTYPELKNETLTTFQIEITSNNEQSLTNKVEYAIFCDNKTKLDLSICDEVSVKINYELKNSSLLDIDTISSFAEEGINILNISDDFFNDICYPYSTNGSDIILEDRVNDIYQNYSICENNCEYEKTSSNNSVTCNCKIKTNITTEEESLDIDEIIEDTFSSSSFNVIKCYNLVFSLDGISGNIGFWIFIILILAHIPFFIYYCLYGYQNIKNFIFDEMKKNNYFKNKNNIKINPPLKNKKKKEDKSEIYDNENKKEKAKNERRLKYKKMQTKNDINKIKNQVEIEDLIDSSCERPIKKVLRKSKTLNSKLVKQISNDKLKLKSNLKQDSESSIKNFKNENKKKKQPIVIINYNKNENYNFTKKSIKKSIEKSDQEQNENVTKRKLKRSITEKNISKKFKEPNFPGYYFLIQININDNKINRPIESKYILTNYTYKLATKYEARGFWLIFLICLYHKQNIMHTFFFKSCLELQSLRICLFIFSYSCDLSLNALFYFNSKISDRYHYTGNNLYLFSLINNITITISSTLLSTVLRYSLKYLTNSKCKIENIFREEEKKIRESKKINISQTEKNEILSKIIEILKTLKIKNIIFIIVEFLLMCFFSYYIMAFCAVYKGTQLSWLCDSLTSILISNLLDFLIAFAIAGVYTASVTYKIEFLYKICLFIYDFGH